MSLEPEESPSANHFLWNELQSGKLEEEERNVKKPAIT